MTAIPTPTDENILQVLTAIKERMELSDGELPNQDQDDRVVRFRDLRSGDARLPQQSIFDPLNPDGVIPSIPLFPFLAPQAVHVFPLSETVSKFIFRWGVQQYPVRLYRAGPFDDNTAVPVDEFSGAIQLGLTSSNVYLDEVNLGDFTAGKYWIYWFASERSEGGRVVRKFTNTNPVNFQTPYPSDLAGTYTGGELAVFESLLAYSADIANLQVTNAQIANVIHSTNYVPGISGWIIRKNGNVEFFNITARGDITASELEVGSATVGYLNIAGSIRSDTLVVPVIGWELTRSGRVQLGNNVTYKGIDLSAFIANTANDMSSLSETIYTPSQPGSSSDFSDSAVGNRIIDCGTHVIAGNGEDVVLTARGRIDISYTAGGTRTVSANFKIFKDGTQVATANFANNNNAKGFLTYTDTGLERGSSAYYTLEIQFVSTGTNQFSFARRGITFSVAQSPAPIATHLAADQSTDFALPDLTFTTVLAASVESLGGTIEASIDGILARKREFSAIIVRMVSGTTTEFTDSVSIPSGVGTTVIAYDRSFEKTGIAKGTNYTVFVQVQASHNTVPMIDDSIRSLTLTLKALSS